MNASIKINNTIYRSAEYSSNLSGNGLWVDGKQICGTCDIHPSSRQLKQFAREDLMEKLVRIGIAIPSRMRVKYDN